MEEYDDCEQPKCMYNKCGRKGKASEVCSKYGKEPVPRVIYSRGAALWLCAAWLTEVEEVQEDAAAESGEHLQREDPDR